MSIAAFAVTTAPLALERVAAHVEAMGRLKGEGCGAVCTFLGVVRGSHKQRTVRYLEYEAHEALAFRAFEIIAAEVAVHWPLATLAIHHRVGRIEIGEASVIVAAASAHRDESFRVCRYGIERIKQIAPVWKHEFFDDGESWVEGPVADPDDAELRRQALERACA
ncbi:MAG: molybdenum cofactor biosynthesis protein MoaE [Acidobacteria bacterium]|nr:molybdenum cofactor biosynthesis protein MoaE [Acidobacteriota bacterium]